MKYLVSIVISAFLVLSMGMGTAMAGSHHHHGTCAKGCHVVQVKQVRHCHGYCSHRHHHHHAVHHHHHQKVCKTNHCR